MRTKSNLIPFFQTVDERKGQYLMSRKTDFQQEEAQAIRTLTSKMSRVAMLTI